MSEMYQSLLTPEEKQVQHSRRFNAKWLVSMAVFVLVGVLCVSLSDMVKDWSALKIKKEQAAAQPLTLQ